MAADPLREKLRELVGELHHQASIYRRGQELFDERQALAYTQCARKIAAILDETEPKPLKLGHEFVPYRGYFVDSEVCIFLGCGQPREAH